MPEANEAQPDSPQPGTQPRRSLVLAMLGWRRRPGKRIPARPTAWGVVLLAVVVFLGGGIAFAEYSMQPDFCRSCHIMEPYYQAWHQSTHRDIPCGDCHFEPGWRHTLKGKFEASSQAVKYITNTYGSKPHAEVRDSSCLRSGCHGERLLEGSVEWEVTSSLGHMVTIRFDHTPHLEELRRGKELRCVSCHSQMVQGKHITVTLDTCFVCHFKGQAHGRDEDVLGGCESCHSAPKPEIRLSTGLFNHADYVGRGVACVNCHSDSIKGDGEVPKQVCWNCHNQATQVARHGEPALIHQVHVTDNKVECSSCHVQIEHNLTAGVPREHRVLGTGLMLDHGGACGQCHESTHAGPDELYRGTGGRGVPDMPSPMYRAQVDCIACHRESGRPLEEASVSGQTYLAAQDSCDYCHGERYRTVLDEWKEALEERILEAEVAYEGARRSSEAAAELDPQTSLEIRRLLDDASHNIRFVRLSHGVHNMNYSMALLSRARENCDEVGTRIEAVTESR
jgi:nitrate/TMAO reductase-like tetraheme cytochrome c subunit